MRNLSCVRCAWEMWFAADADCYGHFRFLPRRGSILHGRQDYYYDYADRLAMLTNKSNWDPSIQIVVRRNGFLMFNFRGRAHATAMTQ